MTHRGPDDQGVHVEGPIGLGANRLSIIDIVGGHQPLSNEDGSIWIVLNGEIYNHHALRKRLEARGHSFRTRCDTETIVHLYEEHGRDCVQHLSGMFAFAIWDGNKRILFIARDRLGIKPLYYSLRPKRFLFGSEIKVLMAHPELSPEFDAAALPEYLAFGYLSGGETFYKGVHKVMPGCWIELGVEGELQTENYWDVCNIAGNFQGGEAECVGEYRRLLENAVESHLMSDVPLGVFLSGGVDSAVVAAMAARASRSAIQTFSVGYQEQPFSELENARTVATHLKSTHHEIQVSREQFFDALPLLIWHEDEPITWPSSVALYFVARLAREHVKVVLTGEGSDETLAGYSRYAFTLRNAGFSKLYEEAIPEFLKRLLREIISTSGWVSAELRRKLLHTFLAVEGNSWKSFYFDNFFSAFNENDQSGLFTDSIRRQLAGGNGYRHVLDHWGQAPGTLLKRMLFTDIKTYLVELLMKQDSMSMAASIESRVPFLDHQLVEFALSIPWEFQVKGMAGKHVLKKAVENLLPKRVIYRKKRGFPTPWEHWLAGAQFPKIAEILSEDRTLDRGYFQPDAVEALLRDHNAGRYDHQNRIWRLLTLELWFRACIDGERPEPPHRELALTEAPV